MRDESQIYDAYDVGDGARVARWSAVVGAVVSLAVLGGVVTWAYKLGVRDAHEVPVVRAVEGPMRVRPEDPGGAQVAHQGRAVYDAIAGAPARIETIALAPPPERLAAEDAPAAPGAPRPAAAPGLSEAIAAEVDQLVAAVLGGGATRDAPSAPAASSGLEPPSDAAPTRSLPPPPRPAGGAGAAPQVTAAAAPASGPAAPSTLPAVVQVQLGAYLSADDAERVWRGFRSRNGDLLAGRSPGVTPLVGTNRTLYLLRAGPFADVAEARGLCGALRARGEECILAGTP